MLSQTQAAAVYAATKGAKPGDVFVSPFIGRLDDIGENGLDLIANITRMYATGDHHVQVLAASTRSLDHFTACLALGADLITAPFKLLKEWAAADMPLPPEDYQLPTTNLKPIPYQSLDLTHPWQTYDISHPLTDKGLAQFASDWNQLVV